MQEDLGRSEGEGLEDRGEGEVGEGGWRRREEERSRERWKRGSVCTYVSSDCVCRCAFGLLQADSVEGAGTMWKM